MSTFAARTSLAARNEARWTGMTVNPTRVSTADGIARRLVAPAAKARYQQVETSTRVPWFIIAVIHEREASQNWAANIAQGDPWNRKSRNVPAGRGPFQSWEEAAVDALTNCAPYAARNRDWSAGGALTLLEKYNGLGYADMGRPSPYIWAWTNQYTSGKYTSDHHYDPYFVDTQPGCAALIKRMMTVDSSISFAGEHNGGNVGSLSKSQIQALQQQLIDKGYPLGAVDGIIGTLTTQAILAFQRDHGLPTTGVPDMITLTALALAPDRRLDPERSTATIEDLLKLGSEIVARSGNTKLIALVSTILGALGLGNSALLPVANSYAGTNPEPSPAAITDVLARLEPLLTSSTIKNATDDQIQAIHNLLAANLHQLSPDLLQTLTEIAPKVLANSKPSDLSNLFSQVLTLQPKFNTIFDALPTYAFPDPNGTMHLLTTGLSLAANAFLPGLGGSLAALGIGLATNFFSNQIMNSRLQDHRNAKHVGR